MAGQDWTRYDSAKRAASKINFRVFVLKDMPPPSSQPLTGSEKSTIKMWLDAEQQGNK
jgi:gamma-glutamyltranspeptidase